MALPSNQDLHLTPIELNHNSRIVRYFIDFIMAHSTSTVKISMKEFQQLFQLSDKFQADKVDKTLMLAMGLRLQRRPPTGDFEPWAVFVFAANRDDADLARASIRAFEGTDVKHTDVYQGDSSRSEGIPGVYVAGLLLAGYDVHRGGYNDYIDEWTDNLHARSWNEVADGFRV